MRHIEVPLDAELLRLIGNLQSVTGKRPAVILEAAIDRYHREIFHKPLKRSRLNRRSRVRLVRRK